MLKEIRYYTGEKIHQAFRFYEILSFLKNWRFSSNLNKLWSLQLKFCIETDKYSRGNPTFCEHEMKGHFIDFIKEKWINILKFDFAYMFLQALRTWKNL